MNVNNPYRPSADEILPLAMIAFMLIVLALTAKLGACTGPNVTPVSAGVPAMVAIERSPETDHATEIEQLRAEIQELHQRTTTLRCLALFQGDRTRAKPPRTWDWQGWDWDGEVWRDSQCGDLTGGR